MFLEVYNDIFSISSIMILIGALKWDVIIKKSNYGSINWSYGSIKLVLYRVLFLTKGILCELRMAKDRFSFLMVNIILNYGLCIIIGTNYIRDLGTD
jgi:hypothetical protein